MTDITIGIAIILSLSAGLFALGLRAGRAFSNFVSAALALGTVLAILSYLFLFRDSLFLAKLVPFPNLIVLANPVPIAGGFLAGLAWERIPERLWRKFLLVTPLVLITLYSAYGRFPEKPPKCENHWSDGVCIQSSPVSCSAASAATLLKAHGISATESEMASLCFIRDSGTTMQGLYRGLKIKTRNTQWDVQAFTAEIDALRSMNVTPAIVKVGLKRGSRAGSIYENQWGWTRGVPHTVVLFRFLEDDTVEIGDPSIGREQWGYKDLQVLWQGEGLRLVKR